MSAPSPVGNILIGGVAWGGSPSGYVEANGNGISGTAGLGGGLSFQGVYIIVTIPGTISLTATGLTSGSIALVEFNPGGGTISAGVSAATADGDPNPMLSGTITLPGSPSLVVAGGGMELLASAVTKPTGYTLGPHADNDGSGKGIILAYNMAEVTSPITPTFTYTGTGIWVFVSAPFLSTGGGGTPSKGSSLLMQGF